MATENQKIVAERVLERVRKGQKVSVSREMSGIYSPEVAKKPGKLTKSKGWQELMKQYLPDSLLAEKHKQLLEKREVVRAFNHDTGEYESIKTDQPHSDVAKALDIAYKLKKRYPKDDERDETQRPQPIIGIQVNVQVNHEHAKDSEAPQADQGSAGRDISI